MRLIDQGTFDTLKRLCDQILSLSPTSEIGDGMVATLRAGADEVQKSLGMSLRPALGEPTRYRDVKPGDFFIIHTANNRILVHQDDKDTQWKGLKTHSGQELVRPRPRSLASGCHLRIAQERDVEIVTVKEAAQLYHNRVIKVSRSFLKRLTS